MSAPTQVLNPPIGQKNTLHFAPGEIIFSQGETDTSIYLIVSGAVDIVLNKANQKISIGRLHPGDYFGEMAAILSVPRQASALAAKPTELYRLADMNIDMLLNSPGLLKKLLIALANRLCHSNALNQPSANLDLINLLSVDEWDALHELQRK